MSEFQYVIFRAIDRPVSEANLEYMHQQSSRAEITPWSFENEYNYSDFRGDALEMMRRGYDIHLHYANFGIRKLLLRFPDGIPHREIASQFFSDEGVQFIADNKGQGGTLCIDPCNDAGVYDYLSDFDELVDRLAPLRMEIMEGDLRPLYLAHLVIATDQNHDPDEIEEGPVPYGLKKLSKAQNALADLYELPDAFIAAAGEGVPGHVKPDNSHDQYTAWLNGQSPSRKDEWLIKLISDPHSNVRSEILIAFKENCKTPAWPVVQRGRTIGELLDNAESVEKAMEVKSAKDAARKKEKRLAAIAEDPGKVLQQTEALVKTRSNQSYDEICKLLSELREAMANTERPGLAEQQAQKLRVENTSCRGLVSRLRKAGFLGKATK